MQYTYVTLNRIFAKLIRDSKAEFSEGDVVEWCGEALEFIGCQKVYEQVVVFSEVKNHLAEIPTGTHQIIQIARDTKWEGPSKNFVCPKDITEEAQPATTGGYPLPSTPVVLNCDGSPMTDYEVAYYRPLFSARWDYTGWIGSSLYRNRFVPVTLATNSFFGSLVVDCETNNREMYSNNKYTIVRGRYIRTSFETGMIAIAVNRQILDPETGYPMIPDNISWVTAITKYVQMKLAELEADSGRQGAENKLQRLTSDWHWYCRQASNVDKGLYGIDEHQSFTNQWNRLIPSRNGYYGFFGNLGEQEQRRFNDPNFRNRNISYD